MAFGIGAFITGSFKEIAEQETRAIQTAAAAAIKSGADKGQANLRAQVAAASLGDGLQKAWRTNFYPKAGRRTDNPAALIFSKATRIHAAFDAGATIEAHNAQWLAIPLQGAIDLGLDRMVSRPGASGGGLKAKWSNVKAAVERFGNLRFIPLRGGGRALLVAEARVGKVKSGVRFYGVKGGSKRLASVPLFLLVRRVSVKKLLDIDGAAQAAGDAMYAAYAAGLSQQSGG